MITSETNQTSRSWHSAALLLVITLVAVTGAVNDLDHLKEFSGDLGRWGASLSSAGTIPVHASGLFRVERITLELPNQAEDQFRWTGRVAQGKSIEVKGVNGSISAEPASGDQLEVTAIKTGRRVTLLR